MLAKPEKKAAQAANADAFSPQLRQRAHDAAVLLESMYPDAECALQWHADASSFNEEAWRLVVMARLSAQCTDERVNLVCRGLFEDFPTLGSFAGADITQLERAIYSCGFYHSKAADLKNAAALILSKHGGRVPDTMDQLLELPGVGRKIANLLLGDIYADRHAVVVDTHMMRIMQKLRLTENSTPEKIERDIRALMPDEDTSAFCHRVVLFGREYCMARKPRCVECPVGAAGLCPEKS